MRDAGLQVLCNDAQWVQTEDVPSALVLGLTLCDVEGLESLSPTETDDDEILWPITASWTKRQRVDWLAATKRAGLKRRKPQ